MILLKTIKQATARKLKSIRNEKLTIMLVPHSGSRGLSFHINYLNVYYLLFLILIFISLSIYIKPYTGSLKEKETNLRRIYDQDNAILRGFNKKFEKIALSLFKMEEASEDIYSLNGQVFQRQRNNLHELFGEDSARWLGNMFQRKQLELAHLKDKLIGALIIVDSSRDFFTNYNHFNPDEISLFPVNDGYIVRGYDLSIPHIALDIGALKNTPVHASASGRVIKSGWNGNYGLAVELMHKDGYKTLYAHNTRLNVQMGDWVDKGQVISYVGTTGNSTGYHLHFEVREHDRAIDPLPFVRFFIRRQKVNPEFWVQIQKNWKGGP
jgi:hypothetical protein